MDRVCERSIGLESSHGIVITDSAATATKWRPTTSRATHGPLAYIRQLQTRLLHLAHARISPAVPEQLPLFSYITTFQYHDLHNLVDIAILILLAQRAWEFATTRTSPVFAPLD
ncbi:hypothetical protein PM082_024544 [Marasmius tenuissimus]|nr:hypothetical protein PM082_024544 [Marasmius tenuissimus]